MASHADISVQGGEVVPGDLERLLAPVRDALGLVERRIALAIQTEQPDLTEAYAALFSGGKRIRPAVTLLCAGPERACSETVVALGAALEMLHSATLIHDDIIDKADRRRGKPTISATQGPDAAILAGDHLFARAAVVVTETQDLEALRIFAQTLVTISAGELEQIRRRKSLPSREDYLRLIHAKTACLFESAALGGALLAGRPQEEVRRFGLYGRNLGLAFQIADDVLDYVGDSSRLGKPTLNDIRRGVLTLPALLYAWERDDWQSASVPDRVPQRQVGRLVQRVIEGGYVERALAMAREYAEAAWRSVESLTDGRYGESLRGLSLFALERVD
ncbi:MAG: polyprenyl synthetase family protein [Anaerolineae bacterium]|nr:polyprenyl synthetase family protein [Anaerolineae bacterium]